MELLRDLILAYGAACLSEAVIEAKEKNDADENKQIKKTLDEMKLLIRNLVANGIPHQMPVTERILFIQDMKQLCSESYTAAREVHIAMVGEDSFLLSDKPSWEN
jgi:hypothetical protein